MPSTFSPNLGIELIESGTGAGTWGDSTNNNLLQLDQAIGGSGTTTLTSAATSGSPNIIYITEAADRSALSDGRNAYLSITDNGTLAGADTYVRFEEDTCERLIWITNSMTNGEDLYIMQGTYNVDRTYILANGDTALLRFDGGGISNASVINVFAGTVDLSGDVSIGGNLSVDGNFTVAGTFTSVGIDDNATGERLQLADTMMTMGVAGASGFGINRVSETGAMVLSGGASPDTGGNIRFFGNAHSSVPYDFEIRSDTTVEMRWDYSANTFNFIGNNILTTGSIKTEDNVYAGNTLLTVDDEFYLGAVNANNPAVYFESNSYLTFDRVASRFYMHINGTDQFYLSELTGDADFYANDITTTGTIVSGLVGAGETSPLTPLHVNGIATFEGATRATLNFRGSSLDAGTMTVDMSEFVIESQASTMKLRAHAALGTVRLYTGVSDTERLRVDDTGAVIAGGSSGPKWVHGTGTPESFVAAPVGSFYSRTDGGAGTSFYVKESGTGNTGWVAK